MKTKADYLELAGSQVAGLRVLSEIPNRGSIASSLTHYEVLEGVRVLSMEDFSYHPPYSTSEMKRVEQLAQEIKESQTISPLIVVEDGEGWYILEGGHRFDALNILHKTHFPALVVKDLESLAQKQGE